MARQRYLPYGEVRWSAGTLPTDFTFTGQRNESTIGLYDYRARFYAPVLGRFVSADTIVPNPGKPQDLNRYAYVRDNPLRYTDPSGHQGNPPGDYDLWIPQLRLAVALNATPGVYVSQTRQDVGRAIGVAQLGLDALESGISIIGSAAPTGILTIGGAAAQGEPTPFGEGAAALVAWAVSMPADTFEDIFGSIDVALNILGDIIGGNTYRDTSANELVVGQDTLLTALEQSVDFAIPGAWADLILNAGGTAYDLSKVREWMPDFLEMRIPIDPDSGLPILSENYLVLYPDALPEDSRGRREILRLLDLRMQDE